MLAKIFTANRIVTLVTMLTALASVIVGIVGVLPHSWQNTAALVAGLLVKGATALKFLEGSQKFDSLLAAQASLQPDVGPVE